MDVIDVGAAAAMACAMRQMRRACVGGLAGRCGIATLRRTLAQFRTPAYVRASRLAAPAVRGPAPRVGPARPATIRCPARAPRAPYAGRRTHDAGQDARTHP